MFRFLPSLSALRAFEASARHLSFTRAGEELNLSQSAVSRQVKHLEEFLGIRLFERVHKRIVLTIAGQTYSRSIRESLSTIETASLDLMIHKGQGGALTVACLPTFGARWLVPRLPKFYKHHPDIELHIVTKVKAFNFEEEDIDAAISFGGSVWPDTLVDDLMQEALYPVCSPEFLGNHGPFDKPEDMKGQTLLQITTRPALWSEWFAAQGLEGGGALSGPKFEHFQMIINAAMAGIGIALVPFVFMQDELQQGRLIPLAGEAFQTDLSYFFIYPEKRRALPNLQTFRQWLVREAAQDKTHKDLPDALISF